MSFHLSLENDRVGKAYPDDPLALATTATIAEAMQLLRAQKTAAVLVCDDDRLLGIFTERDALRVMADGSDLSAPILDVMSRDPVTLSAEESVAEAIAKMSSGGYRHLPILDSSGQPRGLAGVRGIVQYLVDHFPNTVYNLPPNPDASIKQREGA